MLKMATFADVHPIQPSTTSFTIRAREKEEKEGENIEQKGIIK